MFGQAAVFVHSIKACHPYPDVSLFPPRNTHRGSKVGAALENFPLNNKKNYFWVHVAKKMRPSLPTLLCRFSPSTLPSKSTPAILLGKNPQILSVSVLCNPRTVDLTCTFQEQLLVVEDRFLAAQNKNSISQATQFFYLVESSTKEYWLFLSRHEIGQYEGPKWG